METVYLYVADIKNIDMEAALPKLSQERRERVCRCLDIHKQRQLAASELVCAYALQELGADVCLPLCFLEDEYGKPYIEGCAWKFNLTHSGDYVCCAVSETVQVGADVQKMDERPFEKLARKFCSEREYLRLMRYESERRKKFFYEFWARKEAIAKRDGAKKYPDFRKINASWWHVCCFVRDDYMYAVAADKAFNLIVRDIAGI